MRTAMFYGGADIRVEEYPTPLPGPGEVLVRVGAAGICGSDLHPYRGDNPWGRAATGPVRAGHELAGTIAALGDGVSGLGVGQRVGVEPMHLLGCGHCRACTRGDYHLCPTRGQRDGRRIASAGFSEFDVVASRNVFPLPDQVSLEAASLLDVYACGVHALNRIPLRPFDTVVVIGTGPIGMTAGQVARAAGARQVVMVGRRDEVLAVARAVGAADATVNGARDPVGPAIADLTDGLGAEIVIESVGGRAATMGLAADAAAPGGQIGVLGAIVGDVAVPYPIANRKELTIKLINSYATWGGVREFQIALDLIAGGRVQAERLITHRFPLDRIADGFAAADDKRASGALKVIIQP
ncbi:MAG: alcohol dehydrogenase catalytic domain-containing protein [Chloroflexi bacterium]|nr:alcohol dehydrogenase catalytic domain-containing protein [Chloroflexota bacterium]